jgi:hypothetical protein
MMRTMLNVEERGWRRAVIVLMVTLAVLLQLADTTIVNVSLPTIDGALRTSAQQAIAGAQIFSRLEHLTGYRDRERVSLPGTVAGQLCIATSTMSCNRPRSFEAL